MRNLLLTFFPIISIFANDLSVSDTAFMSSLSGILIGFTILFFSVFLTIKVGSK